MKKYCPLSKEIAFARLDKRLNEENKKAILKSKDTIEFYFTLGMWIRNTWIYGNEEERVEALAKDLGEEIFRIKGALVIISKIEINFANDMDEKTIKETLLKGERVTLECKKAKAEVPKSIWLTFLVLFGLLGGHICGLQ